MAPEMRGARGAPDGDLPRGIGRPATRALADAGFTRVDQLTLVREDELRRLHGVGPRAVEVLRGALEARGLGFRP